jgi:hypothetical protein
MMQWGFLDDKLIYGDPKRIIDKTYWEQGSDPKAREESQARVAAAARAFRAVFNCQSEGWVDVRRYNDRLVVLRAHDGNGIFCGVITESQNHLNLSVLQIQIIFKLKIFHHG